MKASRGCRLTRRKGSTADLEVHQSQGCPASGRKIEVRLENSLGMSKVGSRQSRGIPPTIGIEPLDSIERDQHPRPHRPRFMRRPPGYS